jgi:dimethylamine/trimethylamine dehydrogenase
VTDNTVYLETLLEYYEEEVMGEAYFYGLADHIGGAVEREKLALLAEVERRAADVVQPLLEKHDLVPRDESLLKALGEADVEGHRHYSWMELMAYMAGRYPAYLDEFEALERLAPEDDRPALKQLTHHEVVAIDFANKEIAGDPDSLASIREYLDR